MPRTLLILVRHGETDDNKALVFQGQGGRGLNARGREQAQRLAGRLAGGSDGRPTALYSSDLERARETAAILGGALGLEATLDPDLREVHLGGWQGLSYADIEARFPDEYAAWRAGRDIRRGGGETYAELGDRMTRAVDRIAAAHAGGAALIVSHGASLKTLAARVLHVPTEGMRAFRVQANTGITVIERDEDGSSRVLVWNDAAHLHDPVMEALGDRLLDGGSAPKPPR
jgi:broad specificity phosphatase PhoE